MEQPGAPDLRSAFQARKVGAGPVVKRLRVAKKSTPSAGNTSKSPAKSKDTSSRDAPTSLGHQPTLSILAKCRNITQAQTRNNELQAELDAARVALNAAKESEEVAKASLIASQKNEQAAKAALTTSQENDQVAKTALSASQAQAAEAQVEIGELKARILEAEIKAKEERAASSSSSSMEEMLY
ncbi:uncharacterized protein LOC133825286 [Humulus lupulus]|uniref:uncharacterized protein LOC133825286 n=1 Tax=Humulus lupulus TaxID=3486 RepID=UPI002B4099B8|nr:uncharacterized protein LOC133825286 [Humulus lupulus]